MEVVARRDWRARVERVNSERLRSLHPFTDARDVSVSRAAALRINSEGVLLLRVLSQLHLSFVFFESCQSKAFKLSYVHGHHPPSSTRVRILRLGIRQTVSKTLGQLERSRGKSPRRDAKDLRHVRNAKEALFRDLAVRVLVDLPDVLRKVSDRDKHATGRGELRAWGVARVRSAGHG